MKLTRIAALLLILTFLLAGAAWAATATATLTINATVAATAKLTLGTAVINSRCRSGYYRFHSGY